MKNKCHLDLVKNKCNLDKDTMIRLVASNLLMTTHLDVFSTELSPQSMVQWKWFITEFQLGWRNRKGKVGFPTLTHHHSPHRPPTTVDGTHLSLLFWAASIFSSDEARGRKHRCCFTGLLPRDGSLLCPKRTQENHP